MKANRKAAFLFIFATIVFFVSLIFCVIFMDYIGKPALQSTDNFIAPLSAKYEKDGNIYVIDDGSFRIVSMAPDGAVNYTITIKRFSEYVKMYDFAVDEHGNLYVYLMESEYDAYLTKRDIIRVYDSYGRFQKEILSIEYTENSEERPHIFPQIGSLRCDDGYLTFSRVQRDRVYLYSWDIYREELSSSVFMENVADYSIARLTLRNLNNFIYTTREGGIYEVRNGGPSVLRGSFTFTQDDGGIIPWNLDYGNREDIVFFDMISGEIYLIDGGGSVRKALPEYFFNSLLEAGVHPTLTGFGFSGDRFAGVYGDVLWYYDGSEFRTYEDGIAIPLRERVLILLVQIFFILGIAALGTLIYVFFIKILDRFVSIVIKQIIAIIPFTIAGFIIVYVATFEMMITRIDREIFNQLLILAQTGAAMIDGDDVDSLQSNGDYQTEAYKRVSRTIKEVVGDNRDDWNKVYYSAVYKVIGDTEYSIMNSSDEWNIFRPYGYLSIDEGTPEYELINNGRIFVNTINYNDGHWAYSNAPIYNRWGEFCGIFEIGIDLISYTITNLKQSRQIALITALVCLCIIVVIIVIMGIIVRQLASMAKVLAAVGRGDYEVRVDYHGRDELGNVSSGLNSMATELENQFQQISMLNESTIRFVPVQFMQHLGVRDITKLNLGDSVQRDMTVLFFDIRSFSINSEMMSTAENFSFINRILSASGPIIRKHNGFVDKYIGDAVMAIFPVASDAVRAGIEIYHSLVLNRETRITIGGDGINIGIGIHTGSVMMGIIGEEERISSTVISQNVNMASRMESLTKQVKAGMLITRDTMNQIPSGRTEFNCRFIGMIKAAGLNTAVGVFDMLDALPSKIRARRIATRQVFESGIRLYHTKDYQNARRRFEKVVEADPDDVCAAYFLTETERRIKDPSQQSIFIFDRK
ncbi:MAG: HAMP domain-containing protein [Treponema sp.]|jgi:class 3 adenylate cyclase/HAMP domain-containing protein|nr:HAMP domain-containing protein [Treponema sp.]